MAVSSIKDILGKMWRLKDTMDKNSYMVSNWSIGFNTHGKTDKKLFKYYYGNEVKEGTVISITSDYKLNVSGQIYNFGTKKYIDNYGNKPRILIFNPEVTEEDITKFGWFGSNANAQEYFEMYFYKWWNGNVEEVTLQTVLEELGDSIRNLSNYTDPIALLAMSYNIDTAAEELVKPSGTLEITENNTYNVRELESVEVNVPTGMDTSDADATSSDLLLGKTAYVNGEKIEGSIETYDYSTSENPKRDSVLRRLIDLTETADHLFSSSNVDDSVVAELLHYEDTENATTISHIFENSNITVTPSMNLSSCSNMEYAYANCTRLKKANIVHNNYKYIYGIFYNCISLEEAEFSSLKDCSINYIFSSCYSLKRVIIREMGGSWSNSGSFIPDSYHFTGTYHLVYNPESLQDGYIYVPEDYVKTVKEGMCSNIPTQVLPIYSVTSSGNGTITTNQNSNSETILTATPKTNNIFMGWYNGVIKQTLTPLKTVVANYESLDVTYPFELNSNGYYQNTNQEVDDSFSIGRFNFLILNPNQKLRITYLQSSENGYDYGLIGNVDSYLSLDTNTSGYYESLQNKDINEPKEIILENIPIGRHFIDIKYRKDGSASDGSDTLQIKVEVIDYSVEDEIKGEFYNANNEINIGIVNTLTMDPLNLIAVFKENDTGNTEFETPILINKELIITQAYNTTQVEDTLEVE